MAGTQTIQQVSATLPEDCLSSLVQEYVRKHPWLDRIIFMTLSYGNYGLLLIMGNAGFVSPTIFTFASPKPQTLNPKSYILHPRP